MDRKRFIKSMVIVMGTGDEMWVSGFFQEIILFIIHSLDGNGLVFNTNALPKNPLLLQLITMFPKIVEHNFESSWNSSLTFILQIFVIKLHKHRSLI